MVKHILTLCGETEYVYAYVYIYIYIYDGDR